MNTNVGIIELDHTLRHAIIHDYRIAGVTSRDRLEELRVIRFFPQEKRFRASNGDLVIGYGPDDTVFVWNQDAELGEQFGFRMRCSL